MKKIFKSNKDLKKTKDSKHYKIVFATLYLKNDLFQVWKTKERVNEEKTKYI